jgi:hypothetical protein
MNSLVRRLVCATRLGQILIFHFGHLFVCLSDILSQVVSSHLHPLEQARKSAASCRGYWPWIARVAPVTCWIKTWPHSHIEANGIPCSLAPSVQTDLLLVCAVPWRRPGALHPARQILLEDHEKP